MIESEKFKQENRRVEDLMNDNRKSKKWIKESIQNERKFMIWKIE